MTYDVIIVGARCAGAVLGTLLAKAGVKTLLLEADPPATDMPMSTHYIQPPGMDVLDEIGVGDAVRKVTPPSRAVQLRVDHVTFRSHYPDNRAGYCPRRSTVDPMLQDAATAAGAELRTNHRVIELVRDGERVAGVVVETPSGRETLRAKLVVGADGRKSTVARLTGVEEYLGFDMTRGGYWFYFPMPAIWKNDPRYAEMDSFIGFEGDGLRYVFQCDGDLLLMVGAPPQAEVRTWGADYKDKTLAYLRRSQVTGPLVDSTEPIGKGVGLLKARWYYRRPVGPGFALVGDAGNFKDFVTGHGMTDAFLGARRLARAVLDGSEAAFTRYWRERDAETIPLYFDALQLGEVGFNTPFTRMMFEHVARDQALADRFALVAERRISPFEVIPTRTMMGWVLGALLRGRFDVLKPFLATGKRMGEYQREVATRQELARALA
jgi:flavin-dependent dehydrogenase